MSTSLGERIVYYRRRAGISQKKLAALTGIKPSTLSYYEKGKREPNILILISLAKALEITGDALLGVKPQPDLIAQNRDEAAVLRVFRAMNPQGQKRALENMADLSEVPRYSGKTETGGP
jgi:transcriptional regulator with XRE-family HTH domain